MTILTLKDKEPKKLTKHQKVLNFISSAFTATAQKEFYNTKEEQREAILSAHQPLLEDFREFYALLLLSNINDLNKQIVIYNLLRTGRKIPAGHKKSENEIIFQCLNRMPIQRAYKTFKMLRHLKINNSRTRWLAKKFLGSRENIVLEAVKYKNTIKEMVVHNHLYEKKSEVFDFLFDKKEKYTYSLFNDYLKAKKDPEKIYELPYTVAEGFASLHKIPREEFLSKIKKQMTQGEKLRLQNVAKKAGIKIEADWTKFNLVQLFKYLRTQKRILAKHKEAVKKIAQRIADGLFISFGKVRLVLDNSGSSYGSDVKKYHPVSVAQAISEVMSLTCSDYKEILVNGERGEKLLVPVGGSTNLAKAVLKALKDKPELVMIASDGYENEPAGLTAQIIRTYKAKIDKDVKIFHINPVFAAEKETTRQLGETIPVVGIRDVKQLQTSFFLLKAQENLTKAIEEYKDYLMTKKRVVNFKGLPNYLLPKPKE